MARIKLHLDELSWEPADTVWPDYRLGGIRATDPEGSGIFVKVLRRPSDGGGCWCALLRFAPPPGRAIRLTAVAASDEEVLVLPGGPGTPDAAAIGPFTCNPEGLRHGNTFTAETPRRRPHHPPVRRRVDRARDGAPQRQRHRQRRS